MTKSLSLRFQGRIWTCMRKKEKFSHLQDDVWYTSCILFYSVEGSNSQSLHHGKIQTTIGWITAKSCTNIHGPQRMYSNDFVAPLTFHLTPPFSLSCLCVCICILKQNVCTHIHGPQMMYPNDFAPTCYLAPSTGQHFTLSNTIVA